jgi:hypothetical protein
MKWMGDARAKHLPKNLRETLAQLIHTITDIANDSWRKAPIEEVIDEQAMYQNCMKSIEGYLDDGGTRWEDASETCAMIGSTRE